MEKCGCVAIRENNTSRIEYCDLHASAPTLAAEVARLQAENERLREAAYKALHLLSIHGLEDSDASADLRASLGGEG